MILLSDDESLVNNIRKQLKENDGYCPCKLVKNENTKCMCLEFREMDEGVCHCGLFFKIKEG
mgnify:CR=1 FL=1